MTDSNLHSFSMKIISYLHLFQMKIEFSISQPTVISPLTRQPIFVSRNATDHNRYVVRIGAEEEKNEAIPSMVGRHDRKRKHSHPQPCQESRYCRIDRNRPDGSAGCLFINKQLLDSGPNLRRTVVFGRLPYLRKKRRTNRITRASRPRTCSPSSRPRAARRKPTIRASSLAPHGPTLITAAAIPVTTF